MHVTRFPHLLESLGMLHLKFPDFQAWKVQENDQSPGKILEFRLVSFGISVLLLSEFNKIDKVSFIRLFCGCEI